MIVAPFALTEREKETLRLLLRGHDAKSIARELGLSVHTVNERLRDARRKLNVSSSREAARRLAKAEQREPKTSADKDFGVVQEPTEQPGDERAERRKSAGHRLVWLTGGMFIMSLVIAVAALSLAFHGHDASGVETGRQTAPTAALDPTATSAARNWVALLDSQQWAQSWTAAASVFKSQLSAAQWSAQVQPVRKPLGAVSSRIVQSAFRNASLPGAPAGDYEVIQFKTDFAGKPGAIETVALSNDGASWKVAGYFIR